MNISFKFEEAREAVRKALQGEMFALANELSGRVQRQIEGKNITVTGGAGLLGSWSPVLRFTPAGPRVRVASPMPYAAYVEFGTRPHWPPIRPLYTWVERKLDVIALGVSFEGGRAEYTGKAVKRFGRRRTFSRARQIYQVARAIQVSIAKHGTSGKFYMESAIREMGIRYQLSPSDDGTELVYSIDFSDWVTQRGGIQRVLDGGVR